jgi:hypothetical protein
MHAVQNRKRRAKKRWQEKKQAKKCTPVTVLHKNSMAIPSQIPFVQAQRQNSQVPKSSVLYPQVLISFQFWYLSGPSILKILKSQRPEPRPEIHPSSGS